MDNTTIHNEQPGRVPLFTIMLVSALALGYEILLMRLFSIIQYHHFAYMIISLALLGYGASGTFLVFARSQLLKYYPHALVANIVLFGVASVACFLVGQHLLFNPEEILWDYRQWIKLSLLYVLLALPFFFAANCIGLTFTRFKARISEIYGADLFGAGLGSMGVIGLLFVVFPSQALLMLGGLAMTVGAVAWLETGRTPRSAALLFIGAACMFFLLPGSWTALVISPYKGLSQQMRISGSRIIEERTSPLGLLTVVESLQVPLRHAPGLSLNAEQELPEQLGVFGDADTMQVITRYPENLNQLSYLGMTTSALPFHIHQPGNVLILGAGTGTDILQAQYFDVADIEAVELNPQIIDLVQERRGFSGGLFSHENVSVYIGEARGYVSQTKKKYDLIQLATPGSYSGSAAGLYSLNENYMYTREALAEYLGHLTPTGFLSINGWVRLPPRGTLKITATIIETLKQVGIKDPSKHLLLIRGWQSSTLLIKRSALSKEEIGSVKEFCRDRSFDVAYYPGMQKQEANRYNILQQPYFYEGVAGLLGSDSQEFIDRYKFNISPATDDQPYFSH
ncbi:MAG: SAM-dependent methyltransferase, partial [Proteobacteria bacterium]|nr:SAM-dependent methyltransferase [Pseudomonadota bacterium]